MKVIAYGKFFSMIGYWMGEHCSRRKAATCADSTGSFLGLAFYGSGCYICYKRLACLQNI
jgi:hypothetical protein